jgi:hypothetical protein
MTEEEIEISEDKELLRIFLDAEKKEVRLASC